MFPFDDVIMTQRPAKFQIDIKSSNTQSRGFETFVWSLENMFTGNLGLEFVDFKCVSIERMCDTKTCEIIIAFSTNLINYNENINRRKSLRKLELRLQKFTRQH